MPSLASLLPATIAIVATLVFAVLAPLPALRMVAPDLTLIALFCGLSFVPASLPLVFVVVLGIWRDGIYGTPMGLSSVSYLLLWGMVHVLRGKIIKQELLAATCMFAAVSMVWRIAELGVLMLIIKWNINIYDTMVSWLLTALLYAPCHVWLRRLYSR